MGVSAFFLSLMLVNYINAPLCNFYKEVYFISVNANVEMEKNNWWPIWDAFRVGFLDVGTPITKFETPANLSLCPIHYFATVEIPTNNASWNFGIWWKLDFKMRINRDAFVAAIYFQFVKAVYHPDARMVLSRSKDWQFYLLFWICAITAMIEINIKQAKRAKFRILFFMSLYQSSCYLSDPILDSLTIKNQWKWKEVLKRMSLKICRLFFCMNHVVDLSSVFHRVPLRGERKNVAVHITNLFRNHN